MAAGYRAAESSTLEAQRAVAPGFEPFAPDYLLAQRAAQADGRAQRQLALRLSARIRRAAHALMGGAAEADDAAHHALIEVLRSLGGYAGANSLEAWSDRLSARSIVRFARAVRARAGVVASPFGSRAEARASTSGSPAEARASTTTTTSGAVESAPPVPPTERPERLARTLEEFLRQLPSAPREALLLREVFGFDVVQTSQLLRLSPSALREQLARARHSLFERGEPDAGSAPAAAPPGLPESVARWFALRDGDARVRSQASSDGAGASGAQREDDEQARLEQDPDVRRLQRELRSLAQFLDAGRFNRPGARDKKLVEGALSAVRVSSVTPVTSGRASRASAGERTGDAFGASASHWVQPVSLALCALLVLGAFLALAFRVPNQHADRAVRTPGPASGTLVKPTVEALSTAHSVDPRARLQREGKPLGEGAVMREGDVIAASTRPGCFVLSPPVDVCLAPGSEARMARLGLTERSVELLSGRAVVSVERAQASAAASSERVPFAIVVGELRAEVLDADFGVEIDNDMVVVRALRGTLVLSADGDTRVLATAQSAIYHWHQHSLEVAPQLIERARRDWDLLAARVARRSGERAFAASAKGGAALREAKASTPAPTLADAGVAPASAIGAAALEPDPLALPPPPAVEPEAEAEPSLEGLLEQAKQLSRDRLWAEAEQLYELIVTRFPQQPLAHEAWVLQGELLAERLQRPSDALAAFERYLASGGGPLDLRARYGRIVALRKLDRADEERAAVAQFLNLYRSTPQARVLLSAAEVASEDTAEPER